MLLMTVMTKSKDEFRKIMDKINKVGEEYGMRINTDKVRRISTMK